MIGLTLGVLLGSFIYKQYEKRTPTVIPIPTIRPSVPTVIPTEPFRINNSGKVSWYGQEYCDKFSPRCITASGEKFDESAFTCACASYIRLGTFIRFTYQGKSVVAKCNDRGSFDKTLGRVADLSKATFSQLAPLSKGVIQVTYEEL